MQHSTATMTLCGAMAPANQPTNTNGQAPGDLTVCSRPFDSLLFSGPRFGA